MHITTLYRLSQIKALYFCHRIDTKITYCQKCWAISSYFIALNYSKSPTYVAPCHIILVSIININFHSKRKTLTIITETIILKIFIVKRKIILYLNAIVESEYVFIFCNIWKHCLTVFSGCRFSNNSIILIQK